MKQLEKTITSLEVAEMVGRRHDQVMRGINTVISHLSTDHKSVVSNYFIKSTYEDSTGRTLNNYLLTKKGCELYATRMTGEKGTQFAVAYIERFNEMENQLQELNKPSYMIDDPIKRAEKWIVEQKETKELEQENKELKPKAAYHDLVLQSKSLLAIGKIAKDYGMGAPTLNKILHELGVQYKQGGTWMLYYKYQDKGYAQTRTYAVDAEKSNIHLYWTQKGRMFIYEILKEKKGILPIIERDQEQLRLVK